MAKSISKKQPARPKPAVEQPPQRSKIKTILLLARRVGIVICIALVVWLSILYGVARWYQEWNRGKVISMGVSYSFPLAREYGYDPREGYEALLKDIGVKRIRVMSYWDESEPQKGTYVFDDLDYQFRLAEQYGAKLSLAVGLRQPRWPECHWPEWAQKEPIEQWSQDLKAYMKVVVERYKDSPSLIEYQLENEFFLEVFGICPDFTRERLIDEYKYLKQLDSTKPVVVSRSNNGLGIAVGQPRPDYSAISVYKRVWDKTITKDYFEYPFPAWHYGYLAGFTKILTGRDMIIHELQAEPWGPEETRKLSFEEQNKSMDAVRLKARIQYGLASGMRTTDLWGAEWWYWRKVYWKDPTVWDTAKDAFARCDGKTRWLDHCMKD